MSQQQYDSALQHSQQDHQGEYQESQQQISSNENQAISDQEDNQQQRGNKQQKLDKRKKQEKQKEQKRDYYAQYLRPDQDVQGQAPLVVIVQGSPSSGKSSIIRSLVKHFTKQKINDIIGPITLRSSKKQRISIVQCPNDLTSMIDLSKIADIVILAIDASLGFEMETFQFLSLLKGHGFPHILGVLTHLDFYKENKQLKRTKKTFKKRFEYQIGGNAKLMNLSKWDNGTYPKLEIAKLARYISVGKKPEIPWRNSHPYVFVDRWQTEEDKDYGPQDQLDIAFYGYIRGSSYRMNGKIHIVGVGDYMINKIQQMNDPCPQYKKNQIAQEDQIAIKSQDEDDEMFQEEKTAKKQSQITKKKKKRRTLNQNQKLIYAPACNLGTLNFEHTSGYVTIPHDYVKFTKVNEQQDDEQAEEGVKMVRNLHNLKRSMNQRLKNADEDFELFQGVKMHQSDDEDEQKSDQGKINDKKAQLQRMKLQTEGLLIPSNEQGVHRKYDLFQLIYQSKEKMVTHDCSKYHPQIISPPDNLKELFVTGMQTDVLAQLQKEQQSQQQSNPKPQLQNIVKCKIAQQTNFFQKGIYAKIVVSGIKYKTYSKINYSKPIILTRINLGEDNFGFLKVKFKRHRWYSNILKSNDPLIVSSGWRRYQSLPIFAAEDANQRLRFLKYTPKHDFCTVIFYGNFNQQNNNCVFTQTLRNDLKKFRIAGSGLIMEINKSFEVMKKIKLIGQPFKIMKNTAFIRGMFNSAMEVSSYIGAQIRTVSGIRGQIKKANKQGGEGTFRATFQDKILASDIVFCRTWYRMKLQRFYNPIFSFQKNRLMKTAYEIRMEKGIQLVANPDSQYKNIDRAPKVFAPFMLPKKLQAKLPFASADKIKQSKKDQIRMKQSAQVPKMLLSDKQKEIASLIQRLNTIKHQKQDKQKEKLNEKKRLIEARNRPKQQYYKQLKKEQKSQKMASIMRKQNKRNKRQKNQED